MRNLFIIFFIFIFQSSIVWAINPATYKTKTQIAIADCNSEVIKEVKRGYLPYNIKYHFDSDGKGWCGWDFAEPRPNFSEYINKRLSE